MSRDDLKPQFLAQMARILVDLSSGHAELDNRFLGAGAPGPAPHGSMLAKATAVAS